MRNRNDGGYSLALVLVVMAVLAVIATTLATVVISNIENQSDYTQRMQDQYEAQGKLEKVLAELTKNQITELSTSDLMDDGRKSAIQKVIESNCGTEVDASQLDDNTLSFWYIDDNKEKEYAPTSPIPTTQTIFTYDFEISASSGDITVTYDLRLKGNISYTKHTQGIHAGTAMYIITSPKIITQSVDVGGVS